MALSGKLANFYRFHGTLKSFYILPSAQPEYKQHGSVVFSRHRAATFKNIRGPDKTLEIRYHLELTKETRSISERVCTHTETETSRRRDGKLSEKFTFTKQKTLTKSCRDPCFWQNQLKNRAPEILITEKDEYFKKKNATE